MHIFKRDFFGKSLNATLIALLPEITDMDVVNEFRCISFGGCGYKILAEALALSLRKVGQDYWQ